MFLTCPSEPLEEPTIDDHPIVAVLPKDNKRRCSECGRVLQGICKSGKCQTCLMNRSKKERADWNSDPDLQIPLAWESLPDSDDLRADLLWAYNNTVHIKEVAGKGSLIYWGRMTTPPGRGSSVQLKFYDKNPAGFHASFQKAMGISDESDGEKQRGEKRAVAEVRKVLEKYREGK